jgi:hypothetical protein
MTTSTDRQTFRALVADVAAKAKAILPSSINGRLEGAVKLVLAHDVTRLDDGTIEVGSCTDPLKVYRLVGQTCECKDFTDGKAPEGWCRHRLAAGIAKRVRELLPTPTPTPPAPALPEAPASANVRITLQGFDVQVTLRDVDEARLMQRLEELLQTYGKGQPQTQPAITPRDKEEGWCSKHDVPMKQTTKEGRSWWSHRLADGQWCKGK